MYGQACLRIIRVWDRYVQPCTRLHKYVSQSCLLSTSYPCTAHLVSTLHPLLECWHGVADCAAVEWLAFVRPVTAFSSLALRTLIDVRVVRIHPLGPHLSYVHPTPPIVLVNELLGVWPTATAGRSAGEQTLRRSRHCPLHTIAFQPCRAHTQLSNRAHSRGLTWT